jgi:hypothetical protein
MFSTSGVGAQSCRARRFGDYQQLRRAGISVYYLTRNRYTPAVFSRCIQSNFLWNLAASPPNESFAYLEYPEYPGNLAIYRC